MAEILPGGRLCNLEHEFRIAQNLSQFGWEIFHFGFCGDPGPDFIARRGDREIEVEGKCLSPEIGLPVSYGFAGQLLDRMARSLRNRYPDHFVTIRIELLRDDRRFDVNESKREAMDSYEGKRTIERQDFRIATELEHFDSFGTRFSHDLKQPDAIQRIFLEVRSQQGDYGYFKRFDDELVFLNLVPLRENRQLKNILKLISATCERQFTKTRAGYLWIHFQGLESGVLKGDINKQLPYLERLARHTFYSEKRTHISSLVVSGDSEIVPAQFPVSGRSVRGTTSDGYVKAFDNPRSKYDHGPAFAPRFVQNSS